MTQLLAVLMMLSNQCRIISIVLLSIVIVVANAGEFDIKRDVFYEMYCRFSNQSTATTLYEIDKNILKSENLIVNGENEKRMVTGVQNIRWNWHPKRPTRLFIHGYFSNQNTLKKYARAYLERDDFNFIAINWLRGARTIDYVKARHRIQEVGQAVARFIDYLVTLGLNLDELTCIGHSLGTHTCGVVGKNIKSGKMSVIMALDPALPLFHLKDESYRLHYTDAEYVQVIHTNGGLLGVKHPIGHADFYPNFGCIQPSCSSMVPFATEMCSHNRVHDLFLESLTHTSQFWAIKCASYGEIYNECCTESGEKALMGSDFGKDHRPLGLYYLKTNGKSPFALFHLM